MGILGGVDTYTYSEPLFQIGIVAFVINIRAPNRYELVCREGTIQQ